MAVAAAVRELGAGETLLVLIFGALSALARENAATTQQGATT